MKLFKADLHCHTVLSPCGELEMAPKDIIQRAKEKGLDILAVSDHNSTKHCILMEKLAKKEGLFILKGVEFTTKEEIHCLAFFEKNEELAIIQKIIDENLPDIKNNVDYFGYQVVVDEDEDIVEQVERLLLSGLKLSIDEIEKIVHENNGIFIPAHINRNQNSIIGQLGFVPPDLKVDALEISRHVTLKDFLKRNKYLKDYVFIQSSDAHMLDDVAKVHTIFKMENLSFDEIKKALHKEEGREVFIPEVEEEK